MLNFASSDLTYKKLKRITSYITCGPYPPLRLQYLAHTTGAAACADGGWLVGAEDPARLPHPPLLHRPVQAQAGCLLIKPNSSLIIWFVVDGEYSGDHCGGDGQINQWD